MFSLKGKIAVVTGGASGIGAATCERLASAGATCVVADVDDGSELADTIGGAYSAVDVRNAQEVDALVSSTIDHFGCLDILVNNAGVLGPAEGLVSGDLDAVRQMLDVNLMGVAHGVRSGGARMGAGSVIVNMASMAGVVGYPGLGWYGTAKFAVVGLTRHAAVELGPKGIRVNCVCPTGVSNESFTPDDGPDHWAVRSQALLNQHVKRAVTPEEVAAAVHYLCSDEAAMINGHALNLDGGLAAGPSVQLIEASIGETIRQGQAIRT